MNQTTWIVSGGIAIVAIAGLLFMLSGDGLPKVRTQSSETPLPVNNKNVTTSEPTVLPDTEGKTAVLHTSMGDITIKFYSQEAPKTVSNFLKLSGEGFYNGVRFHRVIKGFMNQTGDPLSKDDAKMAMWGTGDPGYKFEDEIDPSGRLYKRGYKVGVVAMANSGPNTNGSQFFIMANDYGLPPLYTIFGEVTDGLDVVEKINSVETNENDRPLAPVAIESVDIL